MEFVDLFQTYIDTELRPPEEALKKICLQGQYPEIWSPFPVEFEEAALFLQKNMRDMPADLLSHLFEKELSEDSFFHSGTDVELYQHLRYLPAYWHKHSFFEIICVLEGTCSNYLAEHEMQLTAGDYCILAPDTRHALGVFSDDCLVFNLLLRVSSFETAFFGVLSDNDILSDFFSRALYHSTTHPYLLFRTGQDFEVRNYIGYAYQEFKRNRQYKNRMLNSVIQAFFITLLRNHGSDVIVPAFESSGHDDNLLLILKYMQEHYCTVTLGELSSFFNYSERQLQRIIKKSTGLSFSENIQKLKMRQASVLLKDSAMPVQAIADHLGYTDVGNFRRIFRKHFGMTPLEYRAGERV